jgi:hypothetical protein
MQKQGLQQQKLTKQKAKLLIKQGGEMEDILYTSMVEKMRNGGDALRNVKDSLGNESMQEYKLGGWTHSGPPKGKSKNPKFMNGGDPSAHVFSKKK